MNNEQLPFWGDLSRVVCWMMRLMDPPSWAHHREFLKEHCLWVRRMQMIQVDPPCRPLASFLRHCHCHESMPMLPSFQESHLTPHGQQQLMSASNVLSNLLLHQQVQTFLDSIHRLGMLSSRHKRSPSLTAKSICLVHSLRIRISTICRPPS